MNYKYFSSFVTYLLIFLWCFGGHGQIFCFIFNMVAFINFVCVLRLWILSHRWEDSPDAKITRKSTYFPFSFCFYAFKSLIHLDFLLVYRVRYRFVVVLGFFFPQINTQKFQNIIIFLIHLRFQLHYLLNFWIYVWHFWPLKSFPLVSMSTDILMSYILFFFRLPWGPSSYMLSFLKNAFVNFFLMQLRIHFVYFQKQNRQNNFSILIWNPVRCINKVRENSHL